MGSDTHVPTLAFRVKTRKGGKLQGFAPDASGNRWTGDIDSNGSDIAIVLCNEDGGTYSVLNILPFGKYKGEINNSLEAAIKLRKLVMIIDQDEVYHLEKQEIPAPISTDKAEKDEERRNTALKIIGEYISNLKELKERALTHREKTVIWVPVTRVTLEKAYSLEVIKQKVKPKEMIPSMDRVSMFRVDSENPTNVVAIGFQPKWQKAKRTYKGVVKAEYLLCDWKRLHPTEKLSTNNPLVEHCLFRHPGTPVCLKTTEEVERSQRQTTENVLDEEMKSLLKEFGYGLPPEKKLSGLDQEFLDHRPKNKAKVSFIKDGSRVYLSDPSWITVHGTSVEKAIKRIGTVAGIDESEMAHDIQFALDTTDNVDGLLGYIHPETFLEYVRTTCSEDIYEYYARKLRKGQLNCMQFIARVGFGKILIKGNVEISTNVEKGKLQILGHSGFCPEIHMECDNWLHMRVGIKSSKAAVSRSLACFIRGVFGCMTEASGKARKHLLDNANPAHLHMLVEHLGDAEMEVSNLYKELVTRAPNHSWTKTMRAVMLNRVLGHTKATVEKNLQDGKFPIEGSVAGAVSVLTKYTDLGSVDASWVRNCLIENEQGDHGTIYHGVCINGTFFYSREAMGAMHVSLGTCDFDDWFGFIPSNLEMTDSLSREEAQLSKVFGHEGKRSGLNVAQYLGVFFRWPQGFREARQSKVWFVGETGARHLYPEARPWVKPWEPGMVGVKPIVDCYSKLFPNSEDVVKKSIPLTEVIQWDKLAAHVPVNLIGRFYNALCAVLGNIVSANNGDNEAIALAMEQSKEVILLWSTSDIVDLEKMGKDSQEFQKIRDILSNVAALDLKVPEFLANHAGKHLLNTEDDWSKGWNTEVTQWTGILDDIQKEIFALGEEYRTHISGNVLGSVRNSSFVLRGEGGNISSEEGHEYARFLLKKWGNLWIQLMKLEKDLQESIDYAVDNRETEEKLHNLMSNMRREVYREMEKSVTQITALSEESQMRIGIGLIMEFMLRVGKESENKEFISKGGSGFLASPMGFKILALGLKPIAEMVFNGNTELFNKVKKGTVTFSARSRDIGRVKTLLTSGATLLNGGRNIVVDAFSTEKDGKEEQKLILLIGGVK